MASTPKKPRKTDSGKRGRPPTEVEWRGIGVRFLPEEKALIADVARKAGMAQAEFIRQGAVKYAREAIRTGEIVLKV